MKIEQYRIARPTKNIKVITKFYNEILGFEIIGSFANHNGYDGIMLGLPNEKYHLEFTQNLFQEYLPMPTKENLLVFYFGSNEEYFSAIDRIKNLGIESVEPENPYWENKSMTYEDPDKWRIVFFNGLYKTQLKT